MELLDRESRWCQHVEAQDAGGNPVHCDDEIAAAWDITGAVYRLFGWERAGALYTQLDRHIHGRRRSFGWPLPHSLELDAMVSLQTFNDRVDTTFEIVRSRLETVPVWSAQKRSNGAGLPEQSGRAGEL